MIRVIALALQALLVVFVAYMLITALAGWSAPAPAPPGRRDRKFRVLVPAHNEASVIAGVLEDIKGQEYPAASVSLWVLADRCDDTTASTAADLGAAVAERSEGPPGKGAALTWYLGQHLLEPDEILVVLDADNRVPLDLLARFADELDSGHRVLQAYLDVTNPEGSWIAMAGAMSYWAGNRMVQLARSNLGWSADLGGTGMALTTEALARGGGFARTQTEDQELGVRLALAGIPVHWLHDVRVRDEKPSTAAVAVRQRARWMAGKRVVARRYASSLLREAIARRSWALVDQVVRLIQPGRSFVALLTALLAVAAAFEGGRWLLPWWVWTLAATLQLLVPILFLRREGFTARRLVWYPALALLAALWVPIAMVSRRASGWYHTPHGE
jgi:cellulose synthase/poly-beta-1,6-N-acetylglucosamine synthase-like glycosyltransferase